MKTFEELDAEYDVKWRKELHELMEQGVSEDEIRKRCDEVIGEYVSMRAALEVEMLESILMKLWKVKPVARRAFLFQSAHYKHVEPHFARCVAVEVAFAL